MIDARRPDRTASRANTAASARAVLSSAYTPTRSSSSHTAHTATGTRAGTAGPDPAVVGDLLSGAGWVDTPAAAGQLGVSGERLLAHRVDAERDGVAVMAGWTRRWHGPSLPEWWAQRRVEPRTPQQVLAEDRQARVRALVAAGATVPRAAGEVGISPSLAYRYLKDSPVHRVSSVGS